MSLSDGEEAPVGKPSFGLFLELRCCVSEEVFPWELRKVSNTQSSGMRSGRGIRGAGAGRTPVFHEERSRRKHALPQWKRAPGRRRPVSLTPFSLSSNTETTTRWVTFVPLTASVNVPRRSLPCGSMSGRPRRSEAVLPQYPPDAMRQTTQVTWQRASGRAMVHTLSGGVE